MSDSWNWVMCPYKGCRFEGYQHQIDEHAVTVHNSDGKPSFPDPRGKQLDEELSE